MFKPIRKTWDGDQNFQRDEVLRKNGNHYVKMHSDNCIPVLHFNLGKIHKNIFQKVCLKNLKGIQSTFEMFVT